MKKVIYLDNAASSHPKPDIVIRKINATLQKIGANPVGLSPFFETSIAALRTSSGGTTSASWQLEPIVLGFTVVLTLILASFNSFSALSVMCVDWNTTIIFPSTMFDKTI